MRLRSRTIPEVHRLQAPVPFIHRLGDFLRLLLFTFLALWLAAPFLLSTYFPLTGKPAPFFSSFIILMFIGVVVAGFVFCRYVSDLLIARNMHRHQERDQGSTSPPPTRALVRGVSTVPLDRRLLDQSQLRRVAVRRVPGVPRAHGHRDAPDFGLRYSGPWPSSSVVNCTRRRTGGNSSCSAPGTPSS
ncbi:MAG: hypothetical protein ACRD1T_27865, partial [Acidimicrobiia bacterium]